MTKRRKDSVLVTGASGLIGSEVCRYFYAAGYGVHGIDNNQRKKFFGSEADTAMTLNAIKEALPEYRHFDIDIRDVAPIREIVEELRPGLIVHCAAQPSHDLAASMPITDFEVNAGATVQLLEAVRTLSPDSVFVYLSTNKVYGDA